MEDTARNTHTIATSAKGIFELGNLGTQSFKVYIKLYYKGLGERILSLQCVHG